MGIQVGELGNGKVHVRLDGRLDVVGVDEVETPFAAALEQGGGDAAVDMSGVVFVASLGIRMFVAAARAMQAAGHRLVLHSCQGPVAEVFEMAALDRLITVVGSEDEATAALS